MIPFLFIYIYFFSNLNICHEHSFAWVDTMQMSVLAEAYFKTFSAIADTMKLYYTEVVRKCII